MQYSNFIIAVLMSKVALKFFVQTCLLFENFKILMFVYTTHLH